MNNNAVNLWTAGFCLLIFISLTALILNIGLKEIETELSKEADIIYNRLTNELNSSSSILNGFNAYFHTVDKIDYKHLEEYSLSIRKQYPHIYMTQYLVRVSKDNMQQFITTRQNEGYSTYRITEFANRDGRDGRVDKTLIPAKARDIYYPIVFMDPLQVKTAALLGYDAYSFPLLREAMNDAIVLGQNTATPPFNLYEGGVGYAVVKAVFTTETLPENDQRRLELATRMVAVIVRVDTLIERLDVDPPYSLELAYLNNQNFTYQPMTAVDNDLNEDSIMPVFHKERISAYAGQTFKLILKRQLSWSDLNYEWLIFAMIVTAAISLLVFNFIHLRLKSVQERMLAQAELFREKELAEVTLHSIGEAVITTDLDHNIKYMNPVAEILTGWSMDEAINYPLESVFNMVYENTRSEVESIVYECLQKNEAVSLEDPILLISKDGKEYSIENSAAPIRDHSSNTVGSVLVFRNITNLRNLSKKMEFQATHDSLTGLINRHEFEHQLKDAVQSARSGEHQHALCYLDLDQFKIVNDTCGHIAGDQLLRELAKHMPQCIRTSDCLARLGGDEFGVLMFDCPLQQAEKVADALRTTIKNFHFSWDKKSFDVGVSIGLVPITKDSGSLQEVLRCADSSCYIAKDLGRNRVHIYTQDDYELAKRHGEMQWLTRIQKAIDEDRFILAVQSIAAICPDEELPHKEILIRMLDEEGNIVPPMSFIPAAERYDMMTTIDRWVIRTAFRKIKDEHQNEKLNCVYNINLSGQTLCDSEILSFIKTEVENFKVSAQHICFEITETAVIANLSRAIDFIASMKKIGCKFALDDFGSGLSSFSYLKKLPVDYLKIDGEFVRDIINDPMDRAIVAAINNIGHEMGLQTVAEYAENQGIIDVLKEIGVDYAQGYGIDKPRIWEESRELPKINNG